MEMSDYYELKDDCYFVEYSYLIVNPAKQTHFDLTEMATYVTQFLAQKVRVSLVVELLRDRYPTVPDPKAFVTQVIQELVSHGLIQPAEPPKVLLSGAPNVTTGSSTSTIVAVLPPISIPKR
jgi:hypothetical protein